MAEPAPVLDLTTTSTERPTVRINGRAFNLKTSNDLTVSEWRRLQVLLPKIGVLVDTAEITKKEATELDGYLEELIGFILLAPASVQQTLGAVTRIQIADFFSVLLTPSLERTRAGLEASAAAGTSSSPSSRGSTRAQRRKSGARGSRSGPSART